MHKSFLAAGAALAGIAVALGAFGAHGLQQLTTDEKILHSYQTGVNYQLYHALALLLTAIIFLQIPLKTIKWAGYCFIIGIFLFSGSLYLITFLKIQNSTAVRFVGPVTPLGGLFFIAGWMLFLIGAINSKKLNR